MRLFKIKDTYYCEINRRNKISLRTKDEKQALIKFNLIEQELSLLDVYKAVFKQLRHVKGKIDEHYNRIISMIDNGDYAQKILSKEQPSGSAFESEIAMQETLIPLISERYGLSNLLQYVETKSGIMDAVADKSDLKVILEFKLGAIKEDYLGQCLRYLKDATVKADILWLIGESITKSVNIYKDFEQIMVFVAKKPLRGKWKIYPYYLEQRFAATTRKAPS